ncbi:hypothetical protein BGZ57DRAFT_890306 [Hyaloscypha finlandica]|nr:hypothetical protein BGZ57DRAFT_890306 [Hyaloscypha finlandica]
MASSRAPLFADPNRHSMESTYDDEETALLGGIATTSPSRPFATSFYPTLYLRSLALILGIPAFIIFIVEGPSYSPSIVFLSFAIARQLAVLGSHFGSQVVVIHIEIVHPKWKSVSAKAQEKWIKKSVAGAIDAGILLGLLVSLAIVAKKVDTTYGLPKEVTHAVILGFIVFGLLLVSITDFGYPNLVTLALAVEKPVDGVLKLATSVQYGEPEETEEQPETHQYGRPGKRNSQTPDDDYV